MKFWLGNFSVFQLSGPEILNIMNNSAATHTRLTYLAYEKWKKIPSSSWISYPYTLHRTHNTASRDAKWACCVTRIYTLLTINNARYYWFSPRGTARRSFKRTGRDSMTLLEEEVTPVLTLRNAITARTFFDVAYHDIPSL